MNAAPNYEQAGDLKIGQVGIANLRVRSFEVERLADEMRERVQRAPALFRRAAVIVDFGGLSDLPSVDEARALLVALRGAGVIPVALAYGTSENDRLAEALDLPTLAKFRAQYERAGGEAVSPAPAPAPAAAATPSAPQQPKAGQPRNAPAPAPTAAPPIAADPGLVMTAPVRSGQQVYAEQRDLTVVGTVGAGAEVMADGSVHIYGSLRGRALAGAQGNTQARIFCQEFHAELVAVAGHYIVADEAPAHLIGKPVQVWLDNETLKIAALD
ncbi:septum site-determining protein MinC [Solilutibacter silvestris]|uniref:Probable septum site-determining protein MinC n=1 Tax=Solilutibacter silvestris TaxID=1645665 RepID=A0A2K1Q3U5_9GAMM|nr:septum site-determining protein MinC [Lysobacter silvestris]PNS09708.1 minC: septum site-determining protein MinC [Lysobacter silvestris]